MSEPRCYLCNDVPGVCKKCVCCGGHYSSVSPDGLSHRCYLDNRAASDHEAFLDSINFIWATVPVREKS